MAKAKKTVSIEKIKRMANDYFFHSGDPFREQRKTLQNFVGSILMDADAYKGFNYLTAEHSKPGHTVGMIFDAEHHNHEFPDDSRVYFY